MKCSNRKCKSPATTRASWGPISTPRKYNEYLCEACLNLVWDQNRRLIEDGVVEWQLSSLTEQEKENGMGERM